MPTNCVLTPDLPSDAAMNVYLKLSPKAVLRVWKATYPCGDRGYPRCWIKRTTVISWLWILMATFTCPPVIDDVHDDW